MKPQRKKSHSIRSGDWVGHVQMMSAAAVQPILPGRFPLKYSQIPKCRYGGAPCCWKMNSSSSACCGINRFCNIFRRICAITLSFTKKFKLNTHLLEMAQNTLIVGLSCSISTTVTGFLDPHIWMLCVDLSG
jgi:hypothetical protein